STCIRALVPRACHDRDSLSLYRLLGEHLSGNRLATLEVELGTGEVGLDPALERGLSASSLLSGKHLLRQGARPLDEIEVEDGIDGPELREPVLGGAQELPRTAELQILLGQLLAVLDAPEDLEPFPRRFARLPSDQEDAPAGTV